MKNKTSILFKCTACEEYVPVRIERIRGNKGWVFCLKCGLALIDVEFTGKGKRFELVEIKEKGG